MLFTLVNVEAPVANDLCIKANMVPNDLCIKAKARNSQASVVWCVQGYTAFRERSSSVVECLTRDQGAAELEK